jgi:hypothetical protein
VRFPSGAANLPPRAAHAVANTLRQVPQLTSYAAILSKEAATALREQVERRLERRRVRGERDEPSPQAVAAGAPGTARPYVERVAAERAAAGPVEVPEPDTLPISDWDHASMPSLRARVARLTLDELLRLRAYETEHAARLAVLTMLDNRIAKIAPTDGQPEP